MKIPIAAMILALWAGYTAGKDRVPVPQWYHSEIHILYAAMLAGTLVFVP